VRPAVRTERLRKEFGAFVAVQGATFQVAQGQTFGLLGPNGAGKSTLIRMLTTLLEPGSGTAEVEGHDVRREPDAVRRTIGVIPQALTSDPDLTAAENLDFYAKLYGVGFSSRRRMVDALLESVDLTRWRNKLVGTFSGGMRRRLEIARSLMHQPRVLFLDEPTTGLDPVSRLHMWEMIQRLKARTGLTLFLTTHYMEEADQLCDHIAVFDHGRIVAEGSPAELKARTRGTESVEAEFAGAPPGWARTLQRLPGVRAVEPSPGRWRIESGDRMRTVEALLAAARRARVGISSLAVGGHTLEDVFIECTGRDIRDEVDDKRRLEVRHLYERRSQA
jgi:ABC-2 type transport system ATP-binding protein